MYKHPLLDRDKISPKEALEVLIEGNGRFTKNLSLHRDLLSIVNITKDKQHPFAAILGCSDSRTASEIIFDQQHDNVKISSKRSKFSLRCLPADNYPDFSESEL